MKLTAYDTEWETVRTFAEGFIDKAIHEGGISC